MTLPVKSLSEIEVKSEVSENDKILILDSETDEARLASKDELKGDKGDQGDPGTPGADGQDGKDGKDGADGKDGVDGIDGAAATISVGTTSTGAAGTSASVTNSGTSSAAVFNFTIPKGDKGDQGVPGQDGQDGQDGVDGNGITSVTSSKNGKTTTVTMNFDEGDPFSFQVQDGADGQGSGDVIGPNSSTDGHLAVFDGITGKIIKDGGNVPVVPTNVSNFNNDAGYITGISSGDVTTALGYTPVNPSSLGTASTKDTGTSSGNVPVLDSNGKLNKSTLPGVALTDTYTVSTSSDLTSLSSAEQGDLAIVTTENKTYVLATEPYSTAGNWKEILAPTGGVTSVNSQTGAVTLDADDISDSTTTNKFVTASEKSTWGGKQDALTLPATPTQGNLVTWGANNKSLVDGGVIPTGVPSGGNNGDVLTNVSGTATWQAPSGGDVMVSSQSGNILTSGMKIWAGTEADYGNLGTYDSNTLYLTI